MTDTAETFRHGATAYRNARDWTEEQRDEAIRQANERANGSQIETLVVNESFGLASSFVSEASVDEGYTMEKSQTSLNEASYTSILEEADIPKVSVHWPLAERSKSRLG